MMIDEQLRRAMKRSGKTIHRLAREAGIQYPTAYGFWHETQTITMRSAAKLAEVLGLELIAVKKRKKG